jgi:hypothetical protein
MRITTLLLRFVAATALAATASGAFGQVTQYSDRTTFETATGATTIVDFSNSYHFPISNGVLDSRTVCVKCDGGPIPAGTIPAGITFSIPVGSGNFFNIDILGGYAGGFLDGLGTSYGNPLNPVTITFNAAQSAFGFDTNDLMGNFTVTAFDGSSAFPTFDYGAAGFYGFQSIIPDITSVQIEGSSGSFDFDFDNFTFNDTLTSGIPEPATWAIMLMGLGGLGVAMRLARRKDGMALSAA